MIGISIRVVFVKHGHTPRGAIEVNHNLVVAMPRPSPVSCYLTFSCTVRLHAVRSM